MFTKKIISLSFLLLLRNTYLSTMYQKEKQQYLFLATLQLTNGNTKQMPIFSLNTTLTTAMDFFEQGYYHLIGSSTSDSSSDEKCSFSFFGENRIEIKHPSYPEDVFIVTKKTNGFTLQCKNKETTSPVTFKHKSPIDESSFNYSLTTNFIELQKLNKINNE